ncbi:MAG: class I SAM-dependent methyltransferase, partial [Betaproteobacteria bacterium]
MTETHFGFQKVGEGEKAGKVREVFRSVAPSYDIMNDLMSAGLHRVWKKFTVDLANVQPGEAVLDVASGTADLALAFAKQAGAATVWQTDINEAMLKVGRDRLADEGLITPNALADAEKLPFTSESFDVVTVAFGLRNMTHKDIALSEMTRVLKP